ncbi:hypothetical protein E2C01_101730 [Portunus trituberculatus]|uniref:Uncharacterized protein n=1 Tax=Portunus trituberculatus TaxID=210409 RepID=A0A5B7KMM5_PORTR|nr:hypothetical protein [Portunus trituberculatus]
MARPGNEVLSRREQSLRTAIQTCRPPYLVPYRCARTHDNEALLHCRPRLYRPALALPRPTWRCHPRPLGQPPGWSPRRQPDKPLETTTCSQGGSRHQ